jgi:hypothetical protein
LRPKTAGAAASSSDAADGVAAALVPIQRHPGRAGSACGGAWTSAPGRTARASSADRCGRADPSRRRRPRPRRSATTRTCAAARAATTPAAARRHLRAASSPAQAIGQAPADAPHYDFRLARGGGEHQLVAPGVPGDGLPRPHLFSELGLEIHHPDARLGLRPPDMDLAAGRPPERIGSGVAAASAVQQRPRRYQVSCNACTPVAMGRVGRRASLPLRGSSSQQHQRCSSLCLVAIARRGMPAGRREYRCSR